MSPMTFEQLAALGSMLLAAATVMLTMRRDGSAERERQAARAAEQQVVSDQLASIADMAKETRDTVRGMSRQLADHGQELARVETSIREHERRISEMEHRCETCRVGGTD